MLHTSGIEHLTFATVPAVEAAVMTMVGAFDHLECYLSATRFIDSSRAGLLLVLQAQVEGRGSLVVKGCRGDVDAALRRLNLHRLVCITA